jgi:hypothetical protein
VPSSVFRLPTGIESREVLRSVRRSSDGADLGTIAQRIRVGRRYGPGSVAGDSSIRGPRRAVDA